MNSTKIYKCYKKDACLGGYVAGAERPVSCAPGYDGFLCHSCTFVQGNKFMRQGSDSCAQCPSDLMNALRIAGLGILYVFWIGILIFFNLRKKKESDFSIMGRIMTNYTQVVATAMNFHFTFPAELLEIFTPLNQFGQSSQMVVSFDCFLQSTRLNVFGSSDYLFKTFVSAFLPFVLICISLCVSLFVKLIL